MHFLCLTSSVMHCSHSLQPDVKRRAREKDFLFVYHWFSVLYLVLKDSVLTLSLLLCMIVFPLKSLTRNDDLLYPGITSVLFRLWSIYLKVYLFSLPLSAGCTWFINASTVLHWGCVCCCARRSRSHEGVVWVVWTQEGMSPKAKRLQQFLTTCSSLKPSRKGLFVRLIYSGMSMEGTSPTWRSNCRVL